MVDYDHCSKLHKAINCRQVGLDLLYESICDK